MPTKDEQKYGFSFSLSAVPSGRIFLLILLVISEFSFFSCAHNEEHDSAQPAVNFTECSKEGRLSFFIIGDYFYPNFVREFVRVAQTVSPTGKVVIVCTDEAEEPISRLFRANGITGTRFFSYEAEAPIMKAWARDVAVVGKSDGRRIAVVSPNKHASSGTDAREPANVIEQVCGSDTAVQLAPFVFEGGNLIFVDAGEQRVLITGRKTVFDNGVYQRRPWANGLTGDSLLKAMKQTFDVDSVIVVGRASVRPPSRLYFEYHIDMGMVVLGKQQAVVSRLSFDEKDRRDLSRAIDSQHNLISPFLNFAQDSKVLREILAERLSVVAAEYEDYAALLEGLGLKVYRSPVRWFHVVASMSRTNVLQTEDRILMPLYPDSARTRTLAVRNTGGRLASAVDVASVDNEEFVLEGYNKANYELYRSMGYQTIPVPEYFHYFMGGLHCFVNVLE